MGRVVILGVFVADCTFRAERAPMIGETILGKSFALGPGGKGSNQAVATARAGADVAFVSKLGADDFAAMARGIWADAGVTPEVAVDPAGYTGAAYIFVEDATGNNAIIISPGVAAGITPEDVAAKADVIGRADVFMTQLEQP
ncbi:MAG: PfkB family carbohydrate kinase, partial [Pseudomonadota bacterium]